MDVFSKIRNLCSSKKDRMIELEPINSKPVKYRMREPGVEQTHYFDKDQIELDKKISEMQKNLDRLEEAKRRARELRALACLKPTDPVYSVNSKGIKLYNFSHPAFNKDEECKLEYILQAEIFPKVLSEKMLNDINNSDNEIKSSILLLRACMDHREEIERGLKTAIDRITNNNIKAMTKGAGRYMGFNYRIPHINNILLVDPLNICSNACVVKGTNLYEEDPYSFPYDELFSSQHNNPSFLDNGESRIERFKAAMQLYGTMDDKVKLQNRLPRLNFYRGKRPVTHDEVLRVESANLPNIDLCFNYGDDVKQLVQLPMKGDYEMMYSPTLNMEVPHHELHIFDDLDSNVVKMKSLQYPKIYLNEHVEYVRQTNQHVVFSLKGRDTKIGISKSVSYDRYGFSDNIMEALYIRDDQLSEVFDRLSQDPTLVFDFSKTLWYKRDEMRPDRYTYKECLEKIELRKNGVITQVRDMYSHIHAAYEKGKISISEYDRLYDMLQ